MRDRASELVDALAIAHLAEVDRKIADLRALRRELGTMLDQCRCGTVAECRIIETLSPQLDGRRNTNPRSAGQVAQGREVRE